MKLLYIFILLFLSNSVLSVGSKNFTVFTPQVDEALRQAPDWLWDTFAGIGIAIGVIFAFVGSRMLRTAGFFFGAFAGALIASIILALIGNVDANIWLPVVLSVALVLGIIVSCILRLAKFVMIIALGATISGIIIQYFLSTVQGLPSWVLYTILGVSIVLVALLTWKLYDFMMIFASAFIGGFVVLVSIARLVRAPISLAGMWADPEFLQACADIICWGPFIGGAAVTFLGLSYQIYRARRKNSKKVEDKKTKRELAAAQKAREQEKQRFEERVKEIRHVAEMEVQAATEKSRKMAQETASEREALLRETRMLELERQRLEKERSRITAETQYVQAEYTSYEGDLDHLPLAEAHSPPPSPSHKFSATLAAAAPKSIKNHLRLGMPSKKPRPDRPPPVPVDGGWGSGPKPWNKCPQHNVTYSTCGCTNPRSKEQVLSELEKLREENARSENEQAALEIRNAELLKKLRQAEAAANNAETQAAIAHRIAEQQVVKNAEVEEKLAREREELERLLIAAEDEKLRIVQEIEQLHEARRTNNAISDGERLNETAAGAAVVSHDEEVEKQNAALDEEELKLKERIAEAEGLETTLREELEILDKQPEKVVTQTDLLLPDEQSKPVKRASNMHLTIPFPGNRFASKWSKLERKYSVDGHPIAFPAAGATSASSSLFREQKIPNDTDENVFQTGAETEKQEGELEPVRDLFADALSVLGKGLQLLFEALVFVIVIIGYGIRACADAARDAQMERQSQAIRQSTKASRQFKATDLKERFSSPIKIEGTI